jgi:hypothetical protein
MVDKVTGALKDTIHRQSFHEHFRFLAEYHGELRSPQELDIEVPSMN